MKEKIASSLSGFCYGYGLAHISFFYFISAMFIESMGLKWMENISSGIRADQTLNIIIFGYITFKIFKVNHEDDHFKIALLSGVGVMVLATILKSFV